MPINLKISLWNLINPRFSSLHLNSMFVSPQKTKYPQNMIHDYRLSKTLIVIDMKFNLWLCGTNFPST